MQPVQPVASVRQAHRRLRPANLVVGRVPVSAALRLFGLLATVRRCSSPNIAVGLDHSPMRLRKRAVRRQAGSSVQPTRPCCDLLPGALRFKNRSVERTCLL